MKEVAFVPVLPLDRMILDFLPVEGSMFAGLYPIGETVKAISVKVTKSQIPSSVISSRMRLLHQVGLVAPINQPGRKQSGRSWQVTEKGQQQLKQWQQADLSPVGEQR